MSTVINTFPGTRSVSGAKDLLEDLARAGSEMIEEGLKYLDHKKIPGNGRMDALFVDHGNSIVAAELNIVEDDNMLFQGLDYYNYVTNNIEALAHIYKNDGLDPSKSIRLMLISPGFSQTLTNRCRWIDANISLYTYKCIKFDGNDEVIPIFSETSIPAPPEPPRRESDNFEDRFGYLTNQEIKEILVSLLSDLPNWGKDPILIEPIRYAISVKTGGKTFMHLSLRRENFLVETHNAEGKWTGYPVNSREDLEMLMALMKSNMENRLK
jgi:hypothetical protein